MKGERRSSCHTQSARWYRGANIPMRVIRRFARQIVERFQPDKIILFGSYAYGTAHADSDVDILVVMPGRPLHTQAARIRWAIPAPFPMDLLVRTPKNLQGLEEGESFHTETDSKSDIRDCLSFVARSVPSINFETMKQGNCSVLPASYTGTMLG
jgi:predicted nucleotidyltransferase